MPSRRAALEVELRHRSGALTLDLAFTAEAPWTVLFGPSGSGKTAIVRAIAGFLRPQRGRVVVRTGAHQPRVLLDRERGIDVAPHRRPLRTAAQGAVIFPARTVRENVAYGAGGESRLVDEALERLQLTDRAESRAEQLSGGEQQRVAIARAAASACAAGPGTWLLLDEPFTGLNLALRRELTCDLPSWFATRELAVLSVTHDVAEVFALKAEVVRIQGGRLVAAGRPEVILCDDRLQLIAELGAQNGSSSEGSERGPRLRQT